MKQAVPTFDTEAALCQAFILGVPEDWIVYPETAGWDILLVHRAGGWQIGIEAKLSLNAKVIAQALEGRRRNTAGPDFRAVLVGKVVAENEAIAKALGLTVIKPRSLNQARFARVSLSAHRWERFGPHIPAFAPDLPETEKLERIGTWWSDWPSEEWFDQFPAARHALPDYVPEVAAGVPSPIILSEWKIKAMRVCVWVERNGSITRPIFKALGIDPTRWMNGHWLTAGADRGTWTAGPAFPAPRLRQEHPAIYERIEADYPVWTETAKLKPKETA